MKITVDPANPQTWPKGRINEARLDATTESELVAQQTSDDATATQATLQTAGANLRTTFDITQKRSNHIG